MCRPHGVPIIGQGGIASAADAIEFLLAGATAVGIGTALFYDPLICPKVNAGILDYLERHGFTSVSEAGGIATGTTLGVGVVHGVTHRPGCRVEGTVAEASS